MHRSVLALAVAGLIMAGCDSNPSDPALASDQASLNRGVKPADEEDGKPVNETTRTAFSRTVMNPCPQVPEPVFVQGYTHNNAHFKFFDGGNQPRLKTNSYASGVGLVTGQKYQFHEQSRVDGSYFYANSTLTTEQMIRHHVISQTNLDNFFVTTKFKQVCTPGSCTVEVISMESDCRG